MLGKASPGEHPPVTQLLQASGKTSPPAGHIYPLTPLPAWKEARKPRSDRTADVQIDLLDLAGVLLAVRRRGLAGYGGPQGPNFLMRTAAPSRGDRKMVEVSLSVVIPFALCEGRLGALSRLSPGHSGRNSSKGKTEEDWAQPRKITPTYQGRLSSLYERKSDQIIFKCLNVTAPYSEPAPCSLGQESLKKKKKEPKQGNHSRPALQGISLCFPRPRRRSGALLPPAALPATSGHIPSRGRGGAELRGLLAQLIAEAPRIAH